MNASPVHAYLDGFSQRQTTRVPMRCAVRLPQQYTTALFVLSIGIAFGIWISRFKIHLMRSVEAGKVALIKRIQCYHTLV